MMSIFKENKEAPESAHQKYKERISNLQSQITPSGSYYLYEGFWQPSKLLEGLMSLQDNFCAKPTDILLSSIPKSGTTWLKALSFAIVTRTRFKSSSSPLLTCLPHDCVPWLEIDLVPNSPFQRDPELPLLGSHIPYTSLPRAIVASGCKIVYIYRDPKDVFVSLWHMMCKLRPESMEKNHGLSEFFELFVKGHSPYGPYWDHVLSYWGASLERPGAILILRYEDLMTNTEFHVKKLAEFIGCQFSVEEEKEGFVEKLVKMCSFENLSNLEVNKKGKYSVGGSLRMVIDNNIFFRKGQMGDWKNYLTPEMAEEMDKITDEKFGNHGLVA